MPGCRIVFQVWESPEGGYEASAVGHDIFTEGDDWEHLEFMLQTPSCATSMMEKSPQRFA